VLAVASLGSKVPVTSALARISGAILMTVRLGHFEAGSIPSSVVSGVALSKLRSDGQLANQHRCTALTLGKLQH
jgi:hypothetical protein